MVRGALTGLVHHKALASPSLAYDDARALTLINTDVAGVETAAEMLHELWGQFLEAVVGFGMLAVEIGWLWPLPLERKQNRLSPEQCIPTSTLPCSTTALVHSMQKHRPV